jgi:hypothetical protein
MVTFYQSHYQPYHWIAYICDMPIKYKIGAQIVSNGGPTAVSPTGSYSSHQPYVSPPAAPGVVTITTRYNQPPPPAAAAAPLSPQQQSYNAAFGGASPSYQYGRAGGAAAAAAPIAYNDYNEYDNYDGETKTSGMPALPLSSIPSSNYAPAPVQPVVQSSMTTSPSAASGVRAIGDISAVKPKTRALPPRFYPGNSSLIWLACSSS